MAPPPAALPRTGLLALTAAPSWTPAGGPAQPLAALDALLLAYLALEGATPRERLAQLLWPTADADAARNALRQRLFRLRKQVQRELVEGTATLHLAAGVEHDLAGAATLLAPQEPPDGAELGAWLLAQRQRLQGAARQQQVARIDALEAAGEAAAALPLALELQRVEPLSEDAHRRVIRLHYLAGDRAAAMLAFDHLEETLKHEVGTTPSAETLALLQTVQAQSEAPPQRLAQVPAAMLRPPRLIGRQAELDALRRGWQLGAVVWVSAEAGMGKSRLLQTLAAEQPGLVASAGRPGDTLVPYATLARLLKELAERAPQTLDGDTRTQLAPLLPWLNAALPTRSAGARLAPLAPLTAWLQRARSEVSGYVLDDLHFADTASIELLQALIAGPRGDASLRWCLGLRPPAPGSPQQALMAAVGGTTPVVTVAVQPLSVAQVAELVDSLHLPGVQGAPIAAALRQRSGGNPLFALETLKLAWAEGSLRRGLDTGTELPRAQSLAQLIDDQLRRLGKEALQLARLAAIAGVDFSLPLAETVLGASALQLADPWHELETQQVLVGAEFAHDLILEAVLAGVPALISRHLHAQVAQWLEQRGGEPARVAEHWLAAGEQVRALPGLQAAAERAHQALREHERINFLLRAADIAEAHGQPAVAFDLVAAAVDSHMNTIRQASGFPLLDRLDGLASGAAQHAAALGRRAWYHIQLAQEQAAIEHGQRALAAAQALPDAALRASIAQRLATALAMAGRFDEALPHFESAAAAATLMAPADRAEYHGNYAAVLDNLGRNAVAREHRTRAIEAAAAAGDQAQQVSQLANQAVGHLGQGDVSAAERCIGQAQRLIASYEMNGSTVGFVATLQMLCARAEGRYDQALAAAEVAQRELGHSNPARLPVVQLHLGHCWLELGQLARARVALAAGQGLPPHFEARRLVLWSRLQRQAGKAARPALEQAGAVAPAQGWPEVRGLVALECARHGPDDAALAALPALLSQAREGGLDGLRLAILLALAPVAARHDAALARICLSEIQSLSSERAPTLTYFGEVALALGDTCAALADEAGARQAWRDGAAAVRRVATSHVAPAFRDSFLYRNPVNQRLLALA